MKEDKKNVLEVAYTQGTAGHLEVAKLIGEPIDQRKPVAFEIAEIADVLEPADPGEHVYIYSTVDDEAEYILVVDGDGVITPVKKSPLGDTEISFQGFNSRLEYVKVEDVLGSPDTNVLARKKEKITRGLDKRELVLLIHAIQDSADAGSFKDNIPSNSAVQSRDAETGEDLYDVIIAMKHKLEDWGDKYVLLVGNTVKEKIDTYDKDNVTSFNYNITLKARLKDADIKVIKVFGKVQYNTTDGGTATDTKILANNKMIMVAQNSRLTEGRPIKFQRRRIPENIARLMGADVDKAQRAVIVVPTPVIADPGVTGSAFSNLLAYGTYAYESLVMAIVNPIAICTSDATYAIN